MLLLITALGAATYFVAKLDGTERVAKVASPRLNSEPEPHTTEISEMVEMPDALKGRTLITGTAQSNTSSASTSLDLVSEFRTAKTAIDAREIIDRAYDAGLDSLAHDMERELNIRCAHMDPNMAPMFERTKWALEQAVAFCSSYTGGEESNSDRPVPPSRGPSITTAKLLSMFTSLGETEFESKFAGLVANASTPREIDIAEEFITAMADSGVNFRLGRSDHSYPQPTAVPDIHRAALDLYSCHRFGGCGPSDWHTLELCFVTGHCEPGWSTLDFYENTLSPVELRLAMDVFYFLSGLQEPDG
jgi:hypothetical protein